MATGTLSQGYRQAPSRTPTHSRQPAGRLAILNTGCGAIEAGRAGLSEYERSIFAHVGEPQSASVRSVAF